VFVLLSLPSPVGCSVMSVSHSLFAASAVNTFLTRSSCTGGPARRVRPFFLANTDQIRCMEHSRATRLRPATMPWAVSSSAMNR
jgi:hypothetical protein